MKYGNARGGETATITGTGFVDGMTVLVGGNACSNVTIVSPTVATIRTPGAGTMAGLGVKDIVICRPDDSPVTLAGVYTNLLLDSYKTNGVNQYASNLAITAPPNGAASYAALLYRTPGGPVGYTFMLGNAAIDERVGILYQTLGRAAFIVMSGGVYKYNLTTANNAVPESSWTYVVITRDAGGIHTARYAPVGGAVSSLAPSAAYNDVPAFDRSTIATLPVLTSYAADTCAAFGIWTRDIFASGELAAWALNPQAIPATPWELFCPGLGGSIAAGYDSWGSAAAYHWDAVAMEAGDHVDDGGAGTAYPVAP